VRLLRKEAGGIEVGGRGPVRGLLKTTWQPTRGGQLERGERAPWLAGDKIVSRGPYA
jgi:hypothetical protein